MDSKKRKRKQNRDSEAGNRFAKRILAPFLITFLLVAGTGVSAVFLMAGRQSGTEEQEVVKENPSVKAEPIAGEPLDLQGEGIADREKQAADPEEATAAPGKYGEILSDEPYMREHHIFAAEARSEEAVTVTFAGDILFDPGYSIMNALRQNGYDLSSCIASEVQQIMRDSDIMMINNEFPYSDRGEPLQDKAFTFRAAKESVTYLEELGVDIVSLANNHAYDYGEDALLDTFDVLEQAGIVYVGAGRNREQAQRAAYYIINDMKIAFLSATQIERLDNPDTREATEQSPGVFRCMDNTRLLEQIRNARENSDFVIVYVHWGTENVAEIDWLQEKQAPEMAEAGADVIIGDHPHCLQKIGVSKGTPVVYSLGNFWFNSKTLDTCLVQITLDSGGLKSVQFIPCLQSGCRTTLLQGQEKSRVIAYMNSISGGDVLNEEGFLSY